MPAVLVCSEIQALPETLRETMQEMLLTQAGNTVAGNYAGNAVDTSRKHCRKPGRNAVELAAKTEIVLNNYYGRSSYQT